MTKESYNCESRPYMTILLVVSILVLLFLRKSSIIKVKKLIAKKKKKELLETNTVSQNYVLSHQEKLSQGNQTDEEEGLMQRVVCLFEY